MTIAYPIGLPGLKSAVTATPNDPLWSSQGLELWPGASVIDGTKSRDAQNTGDLGTIRGGVAMGRVTSGGKWAPAILGASDVAYASGTSLSLTEATGDEVVRRIGASGTFKITGPPTASGTSRTLTVTYSAIAAAGSGHRVATITALTVNEVQTLTFGAAATGGTYRFRVPLANGTFVTTGAITWDTTDATLLSNINTALDTATGVTGGIVATGAAPDTALTFTFSGTGYAGLAQPTEMISVHTFPTSATTATTVRTTTGVDGRFVTASHIQPTDGSETIRGIQGDAWGVTVLDADGASTDVELRKLIVGGFLNTSKLINYPADAGLITAYKAALNAYGKFKFSDDFGS